MIDELISSNEFPFFAVAECKIHTTIVPDIHPALLEALVLCIVMDTDAF